MTFKLCIIACIGALFVQNVSSQCIGAYNGYADGYAWGPNALAWEAAAGPWGPYAAPGTPFAPAPLAAAPFAAAPFAPELGGYTPAMLAASNGAGLAVTSASPIAPTGIAMTSENAYEGVLAVTGALPFLAAVSLEGVVPTAGAGAVTYSCGNGNVAILNEDIAAPAYIAGPMGYRGELGGPLGYNGLAGPLVYEGVGPAGYGGCGCGAKILY